MHTVPDMRNGNLILKWEVGEAYFIIFLKNKKVTSSTPLFCFTLKDKTFSRHTRFALKLKLDFKDLCKEE